MTRRTALAGAEDRVGHVRPDRLPRHAGLRASWYEDVSPAIGRQIAALEVVPGLRERFSYPFPHNFVLLQCAVRPDRTVDDVLLSLRDVNAPLNDADEALNDWFDGLALSLGDRARPSGLHDSLIGWRAARAAGRNLQGVAWAERACAAVRRTLGEGWSLAETLARTAPEVVQAFTEIPAETTAMRRVRIFVPPATVDWALARLDEARVFCPALVDRVETAKEGLGAWDGSWPTVQLHPVGDPELVLTAVRAAGLPHELRTGLRLYERYLELVVEGDRSLDRRQQRSMRSGSLAGSVQR